ncbi:SPOR domain-containing protein [Balneolales bacterium ANBcel1]|nr:SPOR domain-containing protein [Balneolales bacterium ANBcel1]
MKKLLLSVTLFTLVFINYSEAQQAAPSSWSIDLLGGTTFGHFTYASEITPHAGIQFRYSLNPVVSLYGAAGAGQIEYKHDDRYTISYENDYFHYGLGMRMNMLRMLAGPNALTNRVGVYSLAGLGIMYSDVEATGEVVPGFPGQSYTGNTLLYKLGGGITLKLGRRLDFFAQAEWNIANSDLLDGFESPAGQPVSGIMSSNDSFINTSAGFSFKLGSSKAQHADWYDRDHRVDPLAIQLQETIQHLETEVELTGTSTGNALERIQNLQRALDDMTHLVESIHSDQLLSQHNRIENLKVRLDMMEEELADIASEEKVDETVERFFVVGGAFRILDNAETLYKQLQDKGYTDAGIIRDRSRNFYLVVFSGYTSQQEANRALERIRREADPKAWIYRL